MKEEKLSEYFITRYSLIPDNQVDLDTFVGITKEQKFLDWLITFNEEKSKDTSYYRTNYTIYCKQISDDCFFMSFAKEKTTVIGEKTEEGIIDKPIENYIKCNIFINITNQWMLIQKNNDFAQQIETQTDKVIRGIKYCMEITHAEKTIIAIKKKHHKAIKVLQKALENEPDIKMHLMADIYPMGEERAVVRECLGVLLTTTQLPSAARSVVINVETVCKIAEAVDEKKPCISKNMTVRGKLNGGNEAHVFFDVPVGVSVGEMIEKAGGIDGKYGEIIMGGAFTGKSTTLDAPTTKTTGAVLVTIEFPDLHGATMGILVCACGGSEERMREIASKMNAKVVSMCKCKQAIENKPGAPLKCLRPGNCPGQVKNNMQFKKDKCEYILIGNCSDCSNTVMASGPKMGLKVFHQTDHVMRTVGHPLYRSLKVSKEVSQDIDF